MGFLPEQRDHSGVAAPPSVLQGGRSAAIRDLRVGSRLDERSHGLHMERPPLSHDDRL